MVAAATAVAAEAAAAHVTATHMSAAGVAAAHLAASVMAARAALVTAVMTGAGRGRNPLPGLRIDDPRGVRAGPGRSPACSQVDRREQRDHSRQDENPTSAPMASSLRARVQHMPAGSRWLSADSRGRAIGYVAEMPAERPDVFVIGAGVSGLSTALVLLEAGLSVTVYAADPPQRTTSAVAGALWGAHLVGTDERVGGWAAVTLRRFRDLCAEPAAGIREIGGLVASAGRVEPDPPSFARDAGRLTRCEPEDLPAGYTSGWRYTAPVIAMPVHLDYLLDMLLRQGGQLHLGQPLRSLADALDRSAAPVIVNCAGLGARELVPDPALNPVRGQIVVAANPGLTEFFVGEGAGPDEVSYIFPHDATVVLGGTHEPGAASLRPDPDAAERILARCAAVEPRLAGAPVLAHRVGLRPLRPQVRLEAQALPGGRRLVHNYGHGGAGVTLSWGCARAVLAEVTGLAGR